MWPLPSLSCASAGHGGATPVESGHFFDQGCGRPTFSSYRVLGALRFFAGFPVYLRTCWRGICGDPARRSGIRWFSPPRCHWPCCLHVDVRVQFRRPYVGPVAMEDVVPGRFLADYSCVLQPRHIMPLFRPNVAMLVQVCPHLCALFSCTCVRDAPVCC